MIIDNLRFIICTHFLIFRCTTCNGLIIHELIGAQYYYRCPEGLAGISLEFFILFYCAIFRYNIELQIVIFFARFFAVFSCGVILFVCNISPESYKIRLCLLLKFSISTHNFHRNSVIYWFGNVALNQQIIEDCRYCM